MIKLNSKLINKRGYFDLINNTNILSRYTEDLLDRRLEDYEVFELFIMYLGVQFRFKRFTWRHILPIVKTIDETEVIDWLNGLSYRDRNKIVSAGYRFINTLLKKDRPDIHNDQLEIFEMILEILSDVAGTILWIEVIS